MKNIFIIITILFPVISFAQNTMTPEEYAEKYAPLAIKDMQKYRIPASITLAQGILESACGSSRLAIEGNNHFGIKCKTDWTGETIVHDDDEIGECFRKYSSAEDSYRDHSVFLSTRSRYSSLFELDIMDYKAWAKGLKAAGYATNPQYSENLIRIIENFKLYEYDKESAVKKKPETIETTTSSAETITIEEKEESSPAVEKGVINGTKYIIAHHGDSFTTLSFKTGISINKLLLYNDLETITTVSDGDVIYIEKKPKYSSTNDLHIVQRRSTLYDVAQLFGVSLKSLARMNPNLDNGTTLPIGAEVRLR